MLTLLIPAAMPNGVDTYADSETGELVQAPAGSPPPGAPPAAGALPSAGVDPARLAAEQRMLQQDAAAGAAGDTNTPGPVTVPGAVGQRTEGLAAPVAIHAATAPAAAIPQAPPKPVETKVPPVSPDAFRTIAGSARARMQTESSGGQNKEHPVITDATSKHFGHRGGGSSGLMPNTVVALIKQNDELRTAYYDTIVKPLKSKDADRLSVEDANKITEIINADDALDAHISGVMWKAELAAAARAPAEQIADLGGEEAVAYARWHGGPGAPALVRRFVRGDVDGMSEKTLKRAEVLAESVSSYLENRRLFPDESYPNPLIGAAPTQGAPPPLTESLPPEDMPFEDFAPAFEPAYPGEMPPVDTGEVLPLPSGHLDAPAQVKPPMPAVRGGGGSAVGQAMSNLAGVKPSPMTVGELLGDPRAWGRRMDEATSAAAAIAPPIKSAATALAYGAKDIANTPLGERPQFGASQAAANAPPPPPAPLAAGKSPAMAPGASTTSSAPIAPPVAPESDVDILRREIRAAREAYAKGPGTAEIDPKRLWKNKSTGGRILSRLALALGTFGSGMTGSPNAALQIIQQEIADDIESQKLTAAQQQQAWAASYQVLESMIDELQIITPKEGAGTKGPAFSAMSKLMGAREAVRQFGDLRKSYQSLPWGASIKDLKGYAPWATVASKYEADRGPALAQIIFELSGKQSNEREAARLTAMLPSANTWETSAKGLQKFDAIQKWIDHKYAALRDAATTAFPGRDFETLSPEEKRLLSGESDDPNADTMMAGELFADYAEAE